MRRYTIEVSKMYYDTPCHEIVNQLFFNQFKLSTKRAFNKIQVTTAHGKSPLRLVYPTLSLPN
jgi:hypothetical protein